MKKLACGDLMPGCPEVIESENEDDILSAAGKHVVDVHGMEVTPELVELVRGAIRDVDDPVSQAAPA